MIATIGHPQLLVVGANQRSSSVSLRERLFLEPEEISDFLIKLRLAGISNCCLLSTCARVEMVLNHENQDKANEIIVNALAARAGFSASAVAEECIRLEGREAVQHIFEVAASLDSLVVGEPQVLGQVKVAHRIAYETKMIDATLNALLEASYHAAKRVRTETAIGTRPVSLAAAAENLTFNIHGPLSNVDALIIGAGEMGELIAEHLKNRGMRNLTVITRIDTQAAALARRLGAHHASFHELESCLRDSDVVITAVGAGHHVLSRDLMKGVLQSRRHKPIFLIDTGVPADIPPQINELDSAFVYDLCDLENVAVEGQTSGDEELIAAAQIISEEVERFYKARAGREASATVSALRRHFENIRESVILENLTDSGEATRLLVNRLLHSPSGKLRKIAEEDIDDLLKYEETVRHLFSLNDVCRTNEESEK
ncbi:MAG: glutamyl-tRNA reductase [Alphaproteobacteria bacterium]